MTLTGERWKTKIPQWREGLMDPHACKNTHRWTKIFQNGNNEPKNSEHKNSNDFLWFAFGAKSVYEYMFYVFLTTKSLRKQTLDAQDGNEWAQREKKRKAKLSPSTRIQWMVLRGRWQLPIWNGWNGKGRFVIVVHWLADEQYNVQSIFSFSSFLLLSTFSLSFFLLLLYVNGYGYIVWYEWVCRLSKP